MKGSPFPTIPNNRAPVRDLPNITNGVSNSCYNGHPTAFNGHVTLSPQDLCRINLTHNYLISMLSIYLASVLLVSIERNLSETERQQRATSLRTLWRRQRWQWTRRRHQDSLNKKVWDNHLNHNTSCFLTAIYPKINQSIAAPAEEAASGRAAEAAAAEQEWRRRQGDEAWAIAVPAIR